MTKWNLNPFWFNGFLGSALLFYLIIVSRFPNFIIKKPAKIHNQRCLTCAAK